MIKSVFKKTRTYFRCNRALSALPEVYQPILLPGFSRYKAQRPCKDRLELIEQHIGEIESNSTVKDVGCQIGYFSFAMAQKGRKVLGYDKNKRNIEICRMLAELMPESANRPEFIHASLKEKNLHLFGTTDYTLCLAVFHHIICSHGIEAADRLIELLRRLTVKTLYFEIGQSNEPVEPWSSRLPDMGSEVFGWISEFLKKGGFDRVEDLGLVSTHVSDVRRHLVAAS